MSTFPKMSNYPFDNMWFEKSSCLACLYSCFLPGVQQNSTSRVISPGEKPLQQVEPVNSHHKTKKLRLDESLCGGFILILPDKSITSFNGSLMQDDSSKHVFSIFHCLFFPFFCLSRPVVLYFSAPSVASPSGVGSEGVSSSGLRKAGQRKAPGSCGLKAPGAASLPVCPCHHRALPSLPFHLSAAQICLLKSLTSS